VIAAVRIRKEPPRVAVEVREPVHQATFSFTPSTPPTKPSTRQSQRSSATSRAKGTLSVANMGVPPVRTVPSRSPGPLDSVVVARAAILPMTSRPVAGVMMASPTGAARGGFSATASAADSNRVVRLREIPGGRGGRATIVPRPDSVPPR
jgi:hypothetical protein